MAGLFGWLGGFFGDSHDSAGGDVRQEHLEQDAFGSWHNDSGETRTLSTADQWAADDRAAREQQERDSSALSWSNNNDSTNNQPMYSSNDDNGW